MKWIMSERPGLGADILRLLDKMDNVRTSRGRC